MTLNIKQILLLLTLAVMSIANPALVVKRQTETDYRTFALCTETNIQGRCYNLKLAKDSCAVVSNNIPQHSFGNPLNSRCSLCKVNDCKTNCLVSSFDVTDLGEYTDSIKSIKCTWD